MDQASESAAEWLMTEAKTELRVGQPVRGSITCPSRRPSATKAFPQTAETDRASSHKSITARVRLDSSASAACDNVFACSVFGGLSIATLRVRVLRRQWCSSRHVEVHF